MLLGMMIATQWHDKIVVSLLHPTWTLAVLDTPRTNVGRVYIMPRPARGDAARLCPHELDMLLVLCGRLALA